MDEPGFKKCGKCDTELVIITRETLTKIQNCGSAIHSIRKNIVNGSAKKIMICPQCDAYALGMEFVRGFPFKTQDGLELVIQDIEHKLWEKDN